MSDDWMDFVAKDDAAIMQEKQLALLQEIAKNTKPDDSPSENNWYTTVTLDLNTAHDSVEVWHATDDIKANSVVLPAQDIEYFYELEYGKKVRVEAGLIMEITTHQVEMLRITNVDTTDAVMEIVISGVKG